MKKIFCRVFSKVSFNICLVIFILVSLCGGRAYAQRPIDGMDSNKAELFTQTPRQFMDGKLKSNNRGVPVLMYHSIGYEKGNDLRVPAEKFKEQMKYLKNTGFTTLTLDELYDFFQFNKPVPEKSIVITFDDGYVDNYENVYPVLKELGFKAVVFVVSDWIGKNHSSYINSEEIKELDANGIEIQCHTVNHNELSSLSYEKQKQILKVSKETLEKLLDKKVNYLAYPFGHFNRTTITAAGECGYRMAFTIRRGISDKNDGIMTLDRVFISAYDTMSEFKAKVSVN